jgi:hypothetical protein
MPWIAEYKVWQSHAVPSNTAYSYIISVYEINICTNKGVLIKLIFLHFSLLLTSI